MSAADGIPGPRHPGDSQSNETPVLPSDHSGAEVVVEPRLPTFLIIGANKAGTTSLYHYLGDHPNVFMSPVKEPHFFTYWGRIPDGPQAAEATRLLPPETASLRTLADYRGLFADAGPEHTALGEASTGYLCGARIPGLVREHLPDVRLVAILRDPADRAWSEFLMMRRLDQEPISSLGEILALRPKTRYVELGMYAAALDRWLSEFPRAQLHIQFFEDFTREPVKVLSEILAFLGVDADAQVDTETRHNARKEHEPELDAPTRALLVERFREDIRRLEVIIDRDLGTWLNIE